jgi:hypothetical protein
MSEEWPPLGATQAVWCVSTPPIGKLALACVVKRSYRIAGGALSLADDQAPLIVEPEVMVDETERYSWLADDSDLIAEKRATDIVVFGHAHAPQRAKEILVAVAIGSAARRLRVLGERRVEVRADGTVHFSTTGAFESVALIPQNGYGGADLHAQSALETDTTGRRILDLPPELRPTEVTWLYEYPRNSVGAGFFIETPGSGGEDVGRRRADGARLPQIEDPSDTLSPERLFLRSPLAWMDAPMPGSLGWVHHSWYPRLVRYVGHLLEHDEPERAVRESTFPDGDDLNDETPVHERRVHPRSLQGAAPGLAVERLRGDELVVLENLHREHTELKFSLPGEAPVFRLRPAGLKVMTPRPVLQTVRLEPDKDRVTLTWCGTVPLLAKVDEEFVRDTELTVSWEKI